MMRNRRTGIFSKACSSTVMANGTSYFHGLAAFSNSFTSNAFRGAEDGIAFRPAAVIPSSLDLEKRNRIKSFMT